nr:DUF5682 family protein [Paenibacillus pasadenensis]
MSPAGSLHLLALLEEVQPTAVLIEGPSDAGEAAAQLAGNGVVPPVALLAYTDELPIRTLLYPFADYSPEYQALRWAAQNGRLARLIDLPTSAALALKERCRNLEAERLEAESCEQDEDADGDAGADSITPAGLPAESPQQVPAGEIPDKTAVTPYEETALPLLQHRLNERIAELAGEPDYETYWERNFEHAARPGVYRSAIADYSSGLRGLMEERERRLAPEEAALNEIREAYMRRKIIETIAEGHPPDKIVVICGAYHLSGLSMELPGMTDKERAELPEVSTRMTLMPYTYYKLSSRSGYGAGNEAPAYFELMWRCMRQDGTLDSLPSLYLSLVAGYMREKGTWRSTASVIEGVRLAAALAGMHGGLPTLRDLRDAAAVLLGNGEFSVVAEALAQIDIGTAIGYLPEGVSQTPVQADLNRQLKRLKLEKYKSPVAAELKLDLRENRRAKSEEAAFLDLNRSVLLHRLAALGIRFVRPLHVNQDNATWAELWVLQWSPEAEIETVEATLKGETVEIAAAYVLHEKLLGCDNVASAARLIRKASECGLQRIMGEATGALQRLAVDAGHYGQIAETVQELSALLSYGSVRRYDPSGLVPILKQLFLRGALLLMDSASCDDEAAKELVPAIHAMNAVAGEQRQEVDEALWVSKLKELAMRDDLNAKLSGYAFGILLERDEAGELEIEREVARRLSPGISADLGAGWFEGLALRNRYALLSREHLWRQLDVYIQELDEKSFRRSLLFLRRAFSVFEVRERAAVADMLGDIWGDGAEESSELLQQPLNETEKEQLDELNDFDFGDL